MIKSSHYSRHVDISHPSHAIGVRARLASSINSSRYTRCVWCTCVPLTRVTRFQPHFFLYTDRDTWTLHAHEIINNSKSANNEFRKEEEAEKKNGEQEGKRTSCNTLDSTFVACIGFASESRYFPLSAINKLFIGSDWSCLECGVPTIAAIVHLSA